MIKNESSASEVSVLMLDVSERLNASIRMVQETCNEEDFKTYRRAVGKIGSLSIRVVDLHATACGA